MRGTGSANSCRGALCALALALSTCKQTPLVKPLPCPRDSPAFRLQVTSPTGRLPQDFRLKVVFGGASQEGYSRFGDHTQNQTVCCQSGPEVTGELPSVSCSVGSKRDALTQDSGASPRGGTPPLNDAALPFQTDSGAELPVGGGEAGSPSPAGYTPDSGAAWPTQSGADSGAPSAGLGSSAEAVQCELWTNGAAQLEVTAGGYKLVEETLEAERRDEVEAPNCPGLTTKDVRLVLTRGDAGTP